MRARPVWLPESEKTPAQIIAWLSPFCFALRTDQQIADVELLKDVADALKHAVLTARLEQRQIEANDAVIVVSTGYGELPYGEGKYGGTPQVIVRTHNGARCLSTILQNVVDAWRRAAGLDLPEVGSA